jgi:hypothetical protein
MMAGTVSSSVFTSKRRSTTPFSTTSLMTSMALPSPVGDSYSIEMFDDRLGAVWLIWLIWLIGRTG